MAASMTIATLKLVLPRLPGETSVLVRGNHGIGKSQIMRWANDELTRLDGIRRHFFDRRMSQLSEGDVIGLPSLENGATRFNPTDWFMTASREPSFIFLDELNRASTEVMQACFQIVLDRELNGVKLHPETRVVAAVNVSQSYTVNEMDPALIDRFWVVNLEPTHEDWMLWARDRGPHGGDISPLIIDFHGQTTKWLDPPDNQEPSTKGPSRRTWEKLDRALKHARVAENPEDPIFFPICQGFLGSEGALTFHQFARTHKRLVSGEDIFENFIQKKIAKKIAEQGHEDLLALTDRCADYAKTKLQSGLTERQGKNLAAFLEVLYDKDAGSRELMVSFYTNLQNTKAGMPMALGQAVHVYCSKLILKTFNVGMSQTRAASLDNATAEACEASQTGRKKK